MEFLSIVLQIKEILTGWSNSCFILRNGDSTRANNYDHYNSRLLIFFLRDLRGQSHSRGKKVTNHAESAPKSYAEEFYARETSAQQPQAILN